MDVGQNGLPGQHQHHATKVVEQETRPEKDLVITQHQSLVAETVVGKVSEGENVTLSLVKVLKSKYTADCRGQGQLCIFVGPYYLTVSSSGPAGKEQYRRMGVYRQSGETHNNKPVWSRHDGTQKLFYNNGKFIL